MVSAHAIANDATHRLLHAVPKLTAATIHVSPNAHDGHDALSHHHLD